MSEPSDAPEAARELGVEPAGAPWLARLPADFAERVRALRTRRRDELTGAIDRAFEHVPRLLRGALRAVLFG